jgi:transcription elongation factor GreA
MKTVQLTKEGHDNLKKEYQALKEFKRPKTVDALQKARSMGDLSENSAYSSAKEELALVEGRIAEIEAILKSVEIVTNGHNHHEVVIGGTVIVQMDGRQEEYQIVGEFEADPMKKKLSHTSPLGKSLLGKKVGDEVMINVPAGKMIYKVTNIK